MENKINIAQLLKDCPKGMELDCTMLDNVVFEKTDFGSANRPIIIRRIETNTTIHLTKYGQYSTEEDYKCIIFPKGKTSWEGFVPHCSKLKDGDVVFYDNTIAIFKEWGDEILFRTYVTKYLCCDFCVDVNVPLFGKGVRREIRLATEEEKEILFQAIEEHGYKWNEEIKTLEKLIKPEFKVGDIIRHKNGYSLDVSILKINADCYTVKDFMGDQATIDFTHQDNYELVPNKFDINTLVPFESRVLVRDYTDHLWKPAIFGFYTEDRPDPYCALGGTYWKCCIPYEGNEHLLCTTDDCDKFYKTWNNEYI